MGIFACAEKSQCRCTFSVLPADLTPIMQKTIAGKDGPMLTVNDKIPFVNIPPMGICLSPENPIFKATKIPPPCTPLVSGSWIPGSAAIMTSLGPVLTNNSKVVCAFKGVIQITKPADTKVMTI